MMRKYSEDEIRDKIKRIKESYYEAVERNKNSDTKFDFEDVKMRINANLHTYQSAYYRYQLKSVELTEEGKAKVTTIKEPIYAPSTFDQRFTRKGLKQKIEELNRLTSQFAQGLIAQHEVESCAAWFVLRNIPLKFDDGFKILDDNFSDRFIPKDDEALLLSLNKFFVEHQHEYQNLPESHDTKRTVRRMKSFLQNKGYEVIVRGDQFALVGVD